MKTATVRDLRNEFGRISKWLEAGETVQVLKRGQPFAELVPKRSSRTNTLLDATPSPLPLPDDLDDPVGVRWEALQ
jgi:antitoxin (DNA-binding transcriptional repressor) of toxin-antitoxin stability system